ncbi:MAG: hypothetical protein L6M37_05280 [Candidatus Methylarchaceae archaeon HK02M1]|nr:hypothetical protein [Candidatus Methylarchaceae archaeon HK02M1]
MRDSSITNLSYGKGWHIETELGIVNIRLNLTTEDGRRAVAIEIISDNRPNNKAQILDSNGQSSNYLNLRLVEDPSSVIRKVLSDKA